MNETPQALINRLQWGDTITYSRATGWYHEGEQREEDGPHMGGIVGFEDDGLGGTIVQVRVDGWMGVEPIYAVRPEDIIASQQREQVEQ